MKERYDRTIAKPHRYQIGDMVLLKDYTGIPGVSRKLQTVYFKDTYEIVRMDELNNAWLRNCTTNKEHAGKVNIDRLKPFGPQGPKRSNAPEISMTGPSPRPLQDLSNVNVVDYKIVDQKGSGSNRRFRCQWRQNNGRLTSVWKTLQETEPQAVEKWDVH